VLVQVSAHEGLVLQQFDIRTAFLNGRLQEEVDLKPPVGAEHLAGRSDRALRLRRALYGLRQEIRHSDRHRAHGTNASSSS
jgi:hypothetical protein